jgi:putative FmdB family regulatory protein
VPTYQYACTECGEQLEAVQKFTDDPLTVCPACNGRLRKLFNSVGIVFKGSGFYRTDSRNGSSSSPKPDAAATTASPTTESGSTSGDKAGSTSASSATTSAGAGGSKDSGASGSASGTKAAAS